MTVVDLHTLILNQELVDLLADRGGPATSAVEVAAALGPEEP